MQAVTIYAFGDIDVLNFEDVTYGLFRKSTVCRWLRFG